MSGVMAKTKGAEGEREICKLLNGIVREIFEERKLKQLATQDEFFQRNQNQSAVGGDDITNPMQLSLEVKRQESLSVGSWWKQTVASAKRSGGVPVLLFRQNRKPWRVCLAVELPIDPPASARATLSGVRAEIDLETFKQWFREYANRWIGSQLGEGA